MIYISILQCRDQGVRWRSMAFCEQEYNLARSQPGFILTHSCISHLLVYGNVESAARLALENEFIHYSPAIIQDAAFRSTEAALDVGRFNYSYASAMQPIGNFRASVVINHAGVCSRLMGKLYVYVEMWSFNMKFQCDQANTFKENY